MFYKNDYCLCGIGFVTSKVLHIPKTIFSLIKIFVAALAGVSLVVVTLSSLLEIQTPDPCKLVIRALLCLVPNSYFTNCSE